MTEAVKRYHSVAMLLHWLIGALLICNLVLGLLLDDIPNDQKFEFFQLHKSLGISVLALTLVRIIWRFLHPAPALPASLKGWEVFIVKVSHFVFYGLMIFIPFSGWALVSASPKNIPTVLFGLVTLPHLPFFDGIQDVEQRKEMAHAIAEKHGLLAYVLLALLALHIAAALRHHWMLKDETILRMTPRFLEGFLKKLRGERA